MELNEFHGLMAEYASDNENYKKWRQIHGEAFGDTFLSAFRDNPEAQIQLTAALIRISERRFEQAMPLLIQLGYIAVSDFDSAVTDYFTGLNHELLGNEKEMNECYGRLLSSDIHFLYNPAFHPYYRTAKFAQRASECSKALHYYFKALDFYRRAEIDEEAAKSICFIAFDIATVFGYIHDYDRAEHYLSLSYKYDKRENMQRDYVNAVMKAVRGKGDESRALYEKMPPFLRDNCKAMCDAILSGRDVHYCTVRQDRGGYEAFAEAFISEKDRLSALIRNGDGEKAECIISKMLTDAFSFMNKQLECAAEEKDGKITVRCKTYFVRTLAAEYESLFEAVNRNMTDWQMVPVGEFTHYEYKL